MKALLIASSAACILLPAALVPSAATREGAGPDPVHAEHVGVEPAGRLTSTAAQRDAVSITVYNQNFGLVREIRTLDLAQGVFALEYADVASAVQPETVHIRPLTGGALQVLEQNYQYDLLSPQKLLEKYVGRTVRVYRTHPVTGAEEAVDAEVLS
ncbi:MAG TPA: hypothetical protein VLL48_02260, partial [Longimicrobiales bacterium]|nr:hypothetical protein [Longimicrobiales bacterium]